MSFYYQIKNFGGKDRGLKFNGAAEDTMRIHGSASIPYKNLYSLFYGGLIGNCVAKNVEPDFTWEEVTEWVDQLEHQQRVDDITAVREVFEKSQEWKTLIPEDKPEEEKKSEPLKKLKKAS